MRNNRRGPEHGSENPFGRRRGTNGVHPEGMRTVAVPFDELAEDPIDLVAVQADDELISALAAGMAMSSPGIGGYDADDRVAAMLATWRAEVEDEPIPELIDVDTATAAVVAARRGGGRRARHLVPLAGAAALIVFAAAGVSIGAQDARPGDPLWAVTKVLYQEHAQSVEALVVVEDAQERARQALAVGDKDAAAAAVEEGMAAAAVVLEEDGQQELVQELVLLEVAVEETTPGVPNQVQEEPVAPRPEPDPDVPAQDEQVDPVEEPAVDPSTPAPDPAAASTSPPPSSEPAVPPPSPSGEQPPSPTSEGAVDGAGPPGEGTADDPGQQGPGSISGASTSATGTTTTSTGETTSAGQPTSEVTAPN